MSKKNHQRILKNSSTGKRFVAPSAEFEAYQNAAGYFIPRLPVPIKESVNIKCLFYMPTHRRCDLTNLLEAIDDVLVKYGVIEDDNFNIVQSHDGSRVLYDKGNPRTEVYIQWSKENS